MKTEPAAVRTHPLPFRPRFLLVAGVVFAMLGAIALFKHRRSSPRY